VLVSGTMPFVEEALPAGVGVEVEVLAFQKVNEPVDFNNAFDDRSITRLAMTPGLEDNLSRVWEKFEEEFCISALVGSLVVGSLTSSTKSTSKIDKLELDEMEMLTSRLDEVIEPDDIARDVEEVEDVPEMIGVLLLSEVDVEIL
jgi:hypothetical protein